MAIEHWIRYQLAVGAGCRKTGEMIAYFGSAETLYEAGDYEWKLSGIFTPNQVAQLQKVTFDDAYRVLEQCAQTGCGVVCVTYSLFPKMLKNLDDLPAVLYYQGDLSFLIHKIAIAMVGTREADDNSLAIAKSLSASLTRSGAIVVSGGALGVDSAAHIGALEAGGKTVAVLGNGFGANYLAANEALRARIAQNGAVITEYPPFTPAMSRNFPIRNRVISGLSHGTVVVEAGVKSGSLITAKLALDQGREVFAVPGNVLSDRFLGVNKLINEGATPVFSAMDVLHGFAIRYPAALDESRIETQLSLNESVQGIPTKERSRSNPAPKQKTTPKETPPETEQPSLLHPADLTTLSPNAKTIYEAIPAAPIHIDELIRITGLALPRALSALTELELVSLIAADAGKRYHKI